MIYSWIWQKLPGSRWIKVLELTLLLIATVAVLFLVVFPWLSTVLPVDRVTVSPFVQELPQHTSAAFLR